LNAPANTLSIKSITTDFLEITKARLAVSVVFSSLAGFMLGVENFGVESWLILLKLAIGGYGMVGASNAFNQVIEKDLDALMDRTKNRPVPAGRMKPNSALIIAGLLTLIGIAILYSINPKTAMFGAISIFLYTSVYTPLKTMTPLSVFVGAFPGAIPFMLGWVAATGSFGIEAGTLFLIQFFWQFPHFWAIAWVLDEDYKRAGFRLLPTTKQDTTSAIITLLTTIILVPVSLMPTVYLMPDGQAFAGNIYLVIALLAGFYFIWKAILLYKNKDVLSAKNLMYTSFIYLPLLQLTLLFDFIAK
jgi:protoheme IX farnesyltransferase